MLLNLRLLQRVLKLRSTERRRDQPLPDLESPFHLFAGGDQKRLPRSQPALAPGWPGGDEARFKLVTTAYQALGDLTSRRRWEGRFKHFFSTVGGEVVDRVLDRVFGAPRAPARPLCHRVRDIA